MIPYDVGRTLEDTGVLLFCPKYGVGNRIFCSETVQMGIENRTKSTNIRTKKYEYPYEKYELKVRIFVFFEVKN